MTARCAVLLALTFGLSTPEARALEAKECAPRDLAELSAWNGVWVAENLMADVNGREMPGAPPMGFGMKFLGLEAPWNEEGWSRFEAGLRPVLDGRSRLAAFGYPLMMSSPSEFKFIISPSETAIITNYREIRYIYTDGRTHPAADELWPNLWGHSTGCWEGQTLVVETVGVLPGRVMRGKQPIGVGGPPLSEQATFTERLRMTSAGRIEAEFTIVDPERLERPWNVRMSYIRHPVLSELSHDGETLENDRWMLDEAGQPTIAEIEEPGALEKSVREPARLSAADLDRVIGSFALDNSPFELVVERRGDMMFARVTPVEPVFFPIHPADPLNYFSRIHDGVLRFTTDEAGKVIGFSGTAPDGTPISGRRKVP